LAGIGGNDLFGRPIQVRSDQHGAPQTVRQELLETGTIEIKQQMPSTILRRQSIGKMNAVFPSLANSEDTSSLRSLTTTFRASSPFEIT